MVQSAVFVLVASIFFSFTLLQIRVHAQMSMCDITEVFFVLPGEESNTIPFNCDCNDLSTSCVWSFYADRGNILSSGTVHSTFLWNRNVGYGQYICVKDDLTVVKDVLILPQCKEIKLTNFANVEVAIARKYS